MIDASKYALIARKTFNATLQNGAKFQPMLIVDGPETTIMLLAVPDIFASDPSPQFSAGVRRMKPEKLAVHFDGRLRVGAGGLNDGDALVTVSVDATGKMEMVADFYVCASSPVRWSRPEPTPVPVGPCDPVRWLQRMAKEVFA